MGDAELIGISMTEHDPNQTDEAAFAEGFVGISLHQLSRKPDADLAIWQSEWKPGTANHILAEQEWQRRITVRQLHEQFRLEERIANGNRWWSIVAAVIGVIGTLAGVGLGKWLDSSGQETRAVAQTEALAPGQQQTPENKAKSAAPSTASQVAKHSKK